MGLNRNPDLIKAFGVNLRRVRESKELTQEELAYRCELPLSQVGRIERGVQSPTLSTLYILADGLDVEAKVLLDFKFKSKK
jgi:transcriptional regulator with XRE-family HTH domain